MPGNPYDGHTLATVIPDMEALVGNTITRILADKGYRGHHAPPDYKFRVFISGQKRGVTSAIKRQSRRRSAVEPVISHLKAEHRMGRNYLRHRRGDAARRRWLQLPPPDPAGSASCGVYSSALSWRRFNPSRLKRDVLHGRRNLDGLRR
jgi:hypothetical protein